MRQEFGALALDSTKPPELCVCDDAEDGLTTRHAASVVPAIDGINRLFRFVQHAGQRCNGYLPYRSIDAVDDFADGWYEDLAARAAHNVDIVRARLQHLRDGAEIFARVCDDGHADEFVHE